MPNSPPLTPPPQPAPPFGELLDHCRQMRVLPMEQLGAKARIAPEVIATIESGTATPPPRDLVERLVDVLDLEGRERRIFILAGRQAPWDQPPRGGACRPCGRTQRLTRN